MCRTGKVEYPNVRAARVALHSCRARNSSGRDRRHERSFYRCVLCHSFHLTSNPPQKGVRFT
jgi:hypothetical protein